MHSWRLTLTAAAVALVGLTSVARAAPAEPFPADVALGTSEEDGPIYTTLSGMTVYSTTSDETASGKPGCTTTRHTTGTHHLGEAYELSEAMKQRQKTCLEKWPPFVPSANAAPIGKWTIISRAEGFKQWAYQGRPLYLSTKDKLPGDVAGAGGGGRGGRWRTESPPLGFPPGLKLTRTVEGLMLSAVDNQLLFAAKPADELPPDWVAVFAPQLAKSTDDWAPIARADGAKQWSYKAQALYRPALGVTSQTIRAAIKKGVVRPVAFQKAKGPPPGFQMNYTLAGWVYAEKSGKTLYTFSCTDETASRLPCDEIGDPAEFRSSICGTGENCAKEWRPVLAPAGATRSGDWDVRAVPDPPFADPAGGYGENVPMVRAWTYRGAPVYTFTADKKPGDISGHSVRYYGVSRFMALKVLESRDDGERYFADD